MATFQRLSDSTRVQLLWALLDNSHVEQLVEGAIYHAEHTGGGVPEHHSGGRSCVNCARPTSDAASTPMNENQ